MKWLLGLIILILIGAGVWYSGVAEPWIKKGEPAPAATQVEIPNPSGLPTAAEDTSDAALQQDAVAIDAQLQLLLSDLNIVEQSLSDKAATSTTVEVDRRISLLQSLGSRINETKKITGEFKQNFATNIVNHVNGLNTLKSDLTSGSTTLIKAAEQTVKQAYSVFSLLNPQGAIAASADRVVISIDMMIGVGTKLETLISTAASTGNISALQMLLVDLGNQLTAAQTAAQSAVTASATLSPATDAKTTATNSTALKSAHTNIEDARAALTEARQTITEILQALKSPTLGATSTIQVQ